MNNTIEEEKKSDNRPLAALLATAVAMVALCGCLALLVGGVIAIDPFGWNLLDQIFGGADDAAYAMPADTSVYIGLDLLELTPEKIGRVVNPFLAATGEPNFSDLDDALDTLDVGMMDELGFNVQDDILPWLGRYAGVGLSNLEFDDYGGPEEVNWSLIVSTRDESATDEFLVKLRAAISEQSGYDFVTTTYNDVTIYELDTPDSLERFAMARSDGLLLLGAGADMIQANIDAEAGDSLADSDGYRALAAELPNKRAVTFYVDESIYDSLQQDLALGIDPGSVPGISATTVAMSLSLTDEGLQIDAANTIDRGRMTANQQQMLDAMASEPATDELFPESTLIYLAGQRPDLIWASIRDSMSDLLGPGEYDESMMLFAEEYGINPDSQLFPLLDGEWAMGVLPSTAGLLPEELELDLGMAMLAQTSTPSALSANLQNLGDSLEQQYLFVQPTNEAGMEAYAIREDPQGPAMLSYGVGQGYLFVSSDADTTRRIFSDGPSLADNDRYREVWEVFPSGMAPALYMNVSGLLGAIREGMASGDVADFDEVSMYLRPLTTIAMAIDTGDEMIHSTLIVFIAPVE